MLLTNCAHPYNCLVISIFQQCDCLFSRSLFFFRNCITSTEICSYLRGWGVAFFIVPNKSFTSLLRVRVKSCARFVPTYFLNLFLHTVWSLGNSNVFDRLRILIWGIGQNETYQTATFVTQITIWFPQLFFLPVAWLTHSFTFWGLNTSTIESLIFVAWLLPFGLSSVHYSQLTNMLQKYFYYLVRHYLV